MAHGKSQRRGAVATGGIGAVVGRRVGATAVGGAMPCQRVAHVLHIRSGCAIAHDEVQRDGTVAVFGVVQRKLCGVVAGSIGISVNPDVAVAATLFVNARRPVAHGEVQRSGAVAADSVGAVVGGRICREGVSGAVP